MRDEPGCCAARLTAPSYVTRDLSGYINGHLNDMVVDSHGRASHRRVRLREPSWAAPTWRGLLRIDPDGMVTKVAGDMWFPNGSVITEDGTLLVDADLR